MLDLPPDNLADQPLSVVKLRHDGSRVFAWHGHVLEHTGEYVLLIGLFRAQYRDLGYVVLERGDLFVEWYFFDRWYNIFQIYGTDGRLKGWYCNVGRPPKLVAGELHYVDLALDVFVQPNGEYLVLDEDEFAELKATELTPADAAGAEAGLAELIATVTSAARPHYPFDPALLVRAPQPAP